MKLFVWFGVPCLPHFVVMAEDEQHARDAILSSNCSRFSFLGVQKWEDKGYTLQVYEVNEVITFDNT